MDQILKMAQSIYKVLDDKKAQDLVFLSVKGITTLADYFIIATGTSTTHMGALSDYVEKEMAKEAIFIKQREGTPPSGWLLLDYSDVVVHIFSAETRAYYALEHIWNDAQLIEI